MPNPNLNKRDLSGNEYSSDQSIQRPCGQRHINCPKGRNKRCDKPENHQLGEVSNNPETSYHHCGACGQNFA